MAESVPVEVGGVGFWVEISDTSGVRTVGLDETFSFQGVRDTVAAVASELQSVWERVRPAEAEVEFGVKVTAKTGKLSGLLVEGGADATLKVKLVWRRDGDPPTGRTEPVEDGDGA